MNHAICLLAKILYPIANNQNRLQERQKTEDRRQRKGKGERLNFPMSPLLPPSSDL